MIMAIKKKIMNKYFSFIFPLFSRLEKLIDITDYDNYQKRVFGFIAERLFNVWLHKNRNSLNVSYCHFKVLNNQNIVKSKIRDLIYFFIGHDRVFKKKHIKFKKTGELK